MHFHKPKKIHWRRFINRKMVAIAVVVCIAHIVDAVWQAHAVGHVVGKGGEMLLGVTMEHLIFGVPFEE